MTAHEKCKIAKNPPRGDFSCICQKKAVSLQSLLKKAATTPSSRTQKLQIRTY